MTSARINIFVIAVVVAAAVSHARAAELPCSVCSGVRTRDLAAALGSLGALTGFGDGDTLFVAVTVELDGTADSSSLQAVGRSGARPWLRAVFRTPLPVEENLGELELELEELARLVRETGEDLYVQAVWRPEDGSPTPVDLAFMMKKAAVAVTGASTGAVFTAGPLEANPAFLESLYRAEVAAYLDLVTLAPGGDLQAATAKLTELDPGKPLVLDALPWPAAAAETLVQVVENSSAGIALTFFDLAGIQTVDLRPLEILARELSGAPVFDPQASPLSEGEAWSFVREDLDLRVVAVPPGPTGTFELTFADTQLRDPTLVDLSGGEDRPSYDSTRSSEGLTVRVHDPGEVVLLRLERPSAEELAGFDDLVDVSGHRQMPVEEILRRLQAFEDDQARRLEHYQATRTLHLRFQAQQGAFEASYSGEFFSHGDDGFDWVWSEFFVGGVKWRSQRLPKVPLIQPEKVASSPAEIRLSKHYDYRLRGSAVVDGRDCWVIDFRPVDAEPGKNLYRGTVWVDRETYARVRTRASQVGLLGSVLSNEETYYFTPLDRLGRRVEWSSESFVLPLRITGQQTLSILSVTLPVEVETTLEGVRINGSSFAADREAALASDSTMVRDTEDGLRYLRRNEAGERYVEAELDSNRLFIVGGVFWDESVDYPLPLAGVNYLDLDFKDTGAQIDVFFAGAFLAAGISDPQLFGSRWNGGANLNGLFFKASDELYRNGEVNPEETIRRRTASANVFVGRPLAKFLNFELTYQLRTEDFSRADETAEAFVLPQDTLTHILRGSVQYNRAGYRLGLVADMNRRSSWDFWGLPGNTEYSPDQKEFVRWRATFGKTWWLPKFRRVRLYLEHLDGENLDRFSGYDFGMFGDASVSGYQGGLVRAEKANGAHLLAGINYFEKIRFDFKVDAVWASNATTGLDNELLAGIGVEGTTTLPWQLIMNVDAGYAVAGPGKGNFAARVFFLKLFPGN